MRTALAAVLALAAGLCAAPGARADEARHRETVEAQARAYLTRVQVAAGAPGVSAAVAVDGRIVFSGGVGFADLEAGTAQSGTSVHNIGSISKTQAVVGVMQLVEQGLVSLDAEVQTYAPFFPRKEKPITVRHLLTHTSGIRHYKEGEFGPAEVMKFRHYDTFEESTRYWRDDPLLFPPGSAWRYSSYATNLLHAVVETASGKGFEEYLERNVWAPAGMLATRFDVASRIVPGRGRGYRRDPKTGRLLKGEDEDVSYKYAGGGMLSTDEDLCRFASALNEGRLLRPASLQEMWRLQLSKGTPAFDPEEPDRGVPPAETMGLVFFLWRDRDGRRVVGHSGGVKGTSSMLVNYPDARVAVALHLNHNQGVNTRDAAEALARLFLPPVAAGAAR